MQTSTLPVVEHSLISRAGGIRTLRETPMKIGVFAVQPANVARNVARFFGQSVPLPVRILATTGIAERYCKRPRFDRFVNMCHTPPRARYQFRPAGHIARITRITRKRFGSKACVLPGACRGVGPIFLGGNHHPHHPHHPQTVRQQGMCRGRRGGRAHGCLSVHGSFQTEKNSSG